MSFSEFSEEAGRIQASARRLFLLIVKMMDFKAAFGLALKVANNLLGGGDEAGGYKATVTCNVLRVHEGFLDSTESSYIVGINKNIIKLFNGPLISLNSASAEHRRCYSLP